MKNNQPVTKKELNEILDNKLHKWTKKEIEPTVEAIFKKYCDKTQKDIKASENRVMASNDKLAGEIKKDREEVMAKLMSTEQSNIKFKDIDETLKKHTSRLTALETQPA